MSTRQRAIDLYRSGLSMARVASQIGRSISTVHGHLKVAGIPIRKQGAQKEAVALYIAGVATPEVAQRFRITRSTVMNWLRASGVEPRGHGSSKESHPQWRGGRLITKEGYVRIRTGKTRPRYVYEHILVAERALGKPLPSGAEVHHVNEVRGDNKNTNLVICQDRAYHKLLHHRLRALRAGRLELADARLHVAGGTVTVE